MTLDEKEKKCEGQPDQEAHRPTGLTSMASRCLRVIYHGYIYSNPVLARIERGQLKGSFRFSCIGAQMTSGRHHVRVKRHASHVIGRCLLALSALAIFRARPIAHPAASPSTLHQNGRPCSSPATPAVPNRRNLLSPISAGSRAPRDIQNAGAVRRASFSVSAPFSFISKLEVYSIKVKTPLKVNQVPVLFLFFSKKRIRS